MRSDRRPSHMRSALLAPAVVLTLLAPIAAGPAVAQVPFPDADFSGYATGTVVHADALEFDGTRAADVEEAFSGASVDSNGLSQKILNEVDRIVQPALPADATYGRGSGLEIGAGVTADDDNQVIQAAKVEASAPPSTPLRSAEVGPVPADPLAYASLLRGQARARWNPANCILGSDLSFGLGYAADVQLVDTDGTPDGEGEEPTLEEPLFATDAPTPQRSVAQSVSRTRLVPQVNKAGNVEGGALGLMAETRMTIAPVTIGGALTIEFLGEWVLRAVATGRSGFVHYGPGDVSPSTPLIRLIDQATSEVTDVITSQDIFGDTGLVIPIPELGIELAIGEDPRAIGGDADSSPTETATRASGAVDVVRVRLLDVESEFGGSLADLRIGHMEVRAEVPVDGITCGIEVTKDVDKELVEPEEEFTYTITVTNPFDCTLTDVKLVDTISVTEGVTFEVTGSNPQADSVSGNTVVWNDVGPIKPGESRTVTLTMKATAETAAGRFADKVVATANCGVSSADGLLDVNVKVQGEASIDLPEVEVPPPAEVLGNTEDKGALPRTGGALAAAGALGLLTAAGLLRALGTRRG